MGPTLPPAEPRLQFRRERAPAETIPRRGDFWKVKITPEAFPECLYFFGSGLMGGQPLGDEALFLATSSEQFYFMGGY